MLRNITIGRNYAAVFCNNVIAGSQKSRGIPDIRDIHAFMHKRNSTPNLVDLSNKKTVIDGLFVLWIFKDYCPTTSTIVPLLPGTAPEMYKIFSSGSI